MNSLLAFLESADSSVGRVDKSSLSQQTLMQMVMAEVENKEEICGDSEDPRDIEDLNGVKTENDEVKEIRWNNFSIRGQLHLEWLPLTLEQFAVWGNKIVGTINTPCLPDDIGTFFVGGNAFTGSIVLENVPRKLAKLDVSRNELAGSLELGRLPESLKVFRANGNKFSGTVDLTQLPTELALLYLSSNRLSGSLDFDRLPTGMIDLCLRKNRFSGTVNLRQLPSGIKNLDLCDNQLSGEALITDDLFHRVHVRGTKLVKQHIE